MYEEKEKRHVLLLLIEIRNRYLYGQELIPIRKEYKCDFYKSAQQTGYNINHKDKNKNIKVEKATTTTNQIDLSRTKKFKQRLNWRGVYQKLKVHAVYAILTQLLGYRIFLNFISFTVHFWL